MKPYRSSVTAIVGINMHLLLAFACGFTAWAIWPQTPEWWGLGVFSVILGVGAFVGTIKAIRAMASLYAKQRVIAEYMAQGGKPKSSAMASTDKMRQAGMIDE